MAGGSSAELDPKKKRYKHTDAQPKKRGKTHNMAGGCIAALDPKTINKLTSAAPSKTKIQTRTIAGGSISALDPKKKNKNTLTHNKHNKKGKHTIWQVDLVRH